MSLLDTILNRITMYRLTFLGLAGLVLLAIFLASFGVLSISASAIAYTAILLLLFCHTTNILFAKIAHTKPNAESAWITALILTLIVGPLPMGSLNTLGLLLFLAIAAMASKYLLTLNSKHIFNPAGFGVFASALLLNQGASWWVGTLYLAPAVLVFGLILSKKIGRGSMIWSFLATYGILILLLNAEGLHSPGGLSQTANFLWGILVFSPILFFAFVMLPEPQTSPKRQWPEIWYGIFAALALALLQRYLPVSYTLELALLSSNAFAFVIAPIKRIHVQLQEKAEIAPAIFSFWFAPHASFSFIPGQFLEWTLHHTGADSRGIRRYFTIASSPTESGILLTAKIPEKQSTFKKALVELKPGEQAMATGAEGDFVLPKDKNKKLAFIAGGVGITPFRSMAKYLIDKNMQCDIVLLYSANRPEEFVFTELFNDAKSRGLNPVYITERVNDELIRQNIPDWKDRLFYVSGPQPMVKAIEKNLALMGIPKRDIKRDYFPGYETI